MSGPLAGLRVIDLTSVALGPLATMILGDLGAEIIKVEPPEGDITRWIAPARNAGMGALFLNLNRNKRSIVLDLKRPQAAAMLSRLAATADVFVHSMRSEAIARLGFTYAALEAISPRLIYCAAVGYGEDGPYAGRPAYDDIIQGAVGLAALEGANSGQPRYVPTILADKTVGITVVYAIIAALLHRERTGQGQAIEVPMFETMIGFVLPEHLAGHTFVPPLGPSGYARLLAPDRRPYPTRNGHICALPYTTRHWQDFLRAVGRLDLVDDPRFADGNSRSRHVAELYALVAGEMVKKSTDEWVELLEKLDIPVTRINEVGELADNPHVIAVGLIPEFEHPSEGILRAVRPPVLFSRSPADIRLPAPRLGQHSREIMQEIGMGALEIADAFALGVAGK